MAALFIAAGLAIADKVEKKKQIKKNKKAQDELRYRELQTETKHRLARTESGNVIPAVVDGDDDAEEGDQNAAHDKTSPPAYEDVAGNDPRRGNAGNRLS